MKILLDECVTKKLKPFLHEHEVFTVTNMNWNGLKNGNLMSKAVEENFDILLTIDKNLAFQQNTKDFEISIVVSNAKTSKIENLIPLASEFLARIDTFEKGKAIIISE